MLDPLLVAYIHLTTPYIISFIMKSSDVSSMPRRLINQIMNCVPYVHKNDDHQIFNKRFLYPSNLLFRKNIATRLASSLMKKIKIIKNHSMLRLHFANYLPHVRFRIYYKLYFVISFHSLNFNDIRIS